MIVFLVMLVLVGFTAGFATCAAMSDPADQERRYIDDMARRDRG